jgi:hypothetical protein
MNFERLESRTMLAANLPAIYVNAGGPSQVDSIGRTFVADAGFIGGQTAQSPADDVLNTTDDVLFLDYRKGSSFTYAVTLPNANYAVWLEFAEPTFTVAGQRAFDVSAEGQQVLNDFDIVAAAGAGQTAVAKAFDVAIADGQLNLAFAGEGASEAIVSAIAIVPRDPTDAAAPYSWVSMSDTARMVISQSHLRILGQGMAIYANEHKGNYPSSLVALSDYDLRLETFANPRTSTSLPRAEMTPIELAGWIASRNDYIYLGAGKKTNLPADAVLAYENPNRQAGDISILWADLHVSSLTLADAAAKIGFADAPPSDPPPPWPATLPTSSAILQSQANLRALSNGLLLYSNDHRGAYPLELGTLYLEGYVSDMNAFIDPRSGTQPPPSDWTREQKAAWINQNTRYRFNGASGKNSASSEQVLIFEDASLTDGGINILSTDGSVRFVETRWANEMLVHWGPLVKSSSFNWNVVGPQSISLLFQVAIDAASLSGSGIRIENVDTGEIIPASVVAGEFLSTSQLSVRFTFPGYPIGSLPNGNYRVTVPANALKSVGGVSARANAPLEFYMLGGDADRNRVVDIADFNTLAASFGLSGRSFSSGNFDYSSDGKVSISDFNLLAANFGQRVPQPTAPAPTQVFAVGTSSPAQIVVAPRDSDLLGLI